MTIIKWAGGKTRLLPELLRRLPAQHNRYFEPFAGGAALFWRLAPPRAVLGDVNADLINLYAHVRDLVWPLIGELEIHQAKHSERHYYVTRRLLNAGQLSPLGRAAAFMYLNRSCFNGLWRVNRAGEFNTPIGSASQIVYPKELCAASKALAGVMLKVGTYRETTADAGAGDMVYLDPPYDMVTSTSFTAYAGPFGAAEQADLAIYALEMLDRGCHVVASNADTGRVRQLWRGWQIDRVMCARAINSNPDRRGEVAEVIITRPTTTTKRIETMDNETETQTTDEQIITRGLLRSLPIKLTQEQLLEVAQDKARREKAIRQLEMDQSDTTKAFKRRIDEQQKIVEKMGDELDAEEREVPTECYERYAGGMIEVIRTDTGEVCERRSPTMSERQLAMPPSSHPHPQPLGGMDVGDLIEPEPEPEADRHDGETPAEDAPVVFAGAVAPGDEEKPSGRKRKASGGKSAKR